MFGMILTTPFWVSVPGETDHWGYAEERTDALEFEGVIDYVSGNRNNNYMTIHEDTTHIIVVEFREDLYSLLQDNLKATIRDNANNEYNVLLVDNPANQNHHLEIEIKLIPRKVV